MLDSTSIRVLTQHFWLVFVSSLLAISLPTCLVGQEGQSVDSQVPVPQAPLIEAASNEGVESIEQFKFPENLTCELFAAEPDVANVVSIHRDYAGRMFACETFRQEKGVEDNRNHRHWMDEELAARTVQDRINYIRKHIPDADQSYTANDDRIRLLIDRTRDGKPDSVSVFSDRYNGLEMGTGAGVLSYRDKVYYTCIPDLFELQDKNNDGVAEVRTSLHTGFGVRFAFRGHDMHGLIIGPDGRLYFSIGDRGYNVSPKIKDPASGAVFRCELDGRNLEVVATGLRNPQELAFDDYGNLFTGDNNSDSGDKARWVEIVEGGDSGWRMYYQYQEDRGPFNREKIWLPYHDDTPAYIIPPIDNFADGPSGLEYYPGTGFGEEFNKRFFLCDFRGDASRSGVRWFRNQADGAYWKLVDDEQPLWNMLITDIDFGSDGRLYAADWVHGWQGENKGRIYAFFDASKINTPDVRQVESLLRNGMQEQSAESLTELIGHPDQRVRQEAQFELVRRSETESLKQIALDKSQSQLGRVHAIWGLGQLGRVALASGQSFDSTVLGQLFGDTDVEVVGAAVGVAGNVGFKNSDAVASLLRHPNLRVRFRAATSLAKIGGDSNVSAVVEMLLENADKDPIVRHGGIMALNGIFRRNTAPDLSSVVKLADHESRSIRIAICVAMRKLLLSNADGIYKHRQLATKIVAELLGDEDLQVVLEAARVIHDVPVTSKMAALANQIERIDGFADSDALVRRVISANVRMGTQRCAESLAKFAAGTSYDQSRRVEVLNALGAWAKPPARDMVMGDWRPLDPKKRNVIDAKNALGKNFSKLAKDVGVVVSAAITAAGDVRLTEIGSDLEAVALSSTIDQIPRVAALDSMRKLKYPRLENVLSNLQADFTTLPAILAGRVIELTSLSGKEKSGEEKALELISDAFRSGEISTRQSAIATLGKMENANAAKLLESFLRKMIANEFPEELRLDVVLAAEGHGSDSVGQQLKKYTSSMVKTSDPVSVFLDAKVGGDHDAGAKIFKGKTEVSCVRCHKIDGTGGEVGPDLSGVAIRRNRQYLLEAIVQPNKEITEGFAQVKVLTDDGGLHVGIVKKETDEHLVLMDADGKEITLDQDMIQGVKPGKSSMPDDLVQHLTKRELRDLIEYLANRKSRPVSGEGHK